MTAIGTYADGTSADLSTSATWPWNDLVNVSNGLVVAKGTGVTTITVASGAITSAPTRITVRAGPPLSLHTFDIDVREGFSTSMGAAALYGRRGLAYELNSNEVTWSVGDPAIATVTGAILTGRKAGQTVYSGAFAGVTSDVNAVRVLPAEQLLSLQLSETRLVLSSIGQVAWMQVMGAFEGGANSSADDLTLDATFTTGNPRVATVSNQPDTRGVIVAVGVGTTSLTATVRGLSVTTTITVDPTMP